MPDYADHATEAEQREREEALAAHEAEQARQRRIAESMRPYDPSLPVNCVECGEEIPAERLKNYPHTRRCTPCASDIEVRNKWNS